MVWPMFNSCRCGKVRIVGIGIDIVETARIERSIERVGERFLHRVFLDAEIAYCRSQTRPAMHLAARFAVKEAVSKAFGTGIGGALGWRDVEVRRRESGEPYVVFHGGGSALAGRRGVTAAWVSITHSDAYAAANAVLVGD